jgi:tetratricopeptide (TPR) repeat protein
VNTTRRGIATSCAAIALAALAAVPAAMAGDAAAKQASEQVGRGFAAAKDGYWQEALFRFERANELTPNQPRILNNIAISLEAAGRFEEALATYEAALAIAPNDRALRRNYSLFKEFYESQMETQPAAAEDKAGEQPPPTGSADGEEKDDA